MSNVKKEVDSLIRMLAAAYRERIRLASQLDAAQKAVAEMASQSEAARNAVSELDRMKAELEKAHENFALRCKVGDPCYLELISVGQGQKIPCIKMLREICDLSLKEAKDIVESHCPKFIVPADLMQWVLRKAAAAGAVMVTVEAPSSDEPVYVVKTIMRT